MKTHSFLKPALVAIGLLAGTLATAQTYPSQPVHIVVPFPAGGGLDMIARVLQPRLSEYLGQPVIVENKAGASGVIGSSYVARAPADGYTLMVTYDVIASNPHLYKAAPKANAFDYVSLLVSTPQLLVAGTNFKPNSMQELIDAARLKPDNVTYGTPGAGSSNHIGMLLVSQQARSQMLHVPYSGGAPLVQALLGNQIDVAFTLPTGVLPSVRAGKLKAVAVGGTKRLPQLPDVPTIAETLPGFKLTSWYVLAGPKGMPPAVLDRLQREVRRALAVPEVREKLEASGFAIEGSSPEEASSFVKSESEKLGKVVRDFSVTVE